MSTSKTTASLDSLVFIASRYKGCEMLGVGEALSKLHARFWGRSMAEDEKAWRAQQESTSLPTGSHSEGDEIKPGCYVLDINSTIICVKQIWIRAEYIRIYDYLVKFYDEEISYNGRAPSAVLTGQPGVGKSIWIYYALRRCLAERRPVIWRFGSNTYIFVEEGVYDMGPDFSAFEYKSIIWALVDSDESHSGVPVEFVRHNSRFFVIFVTFPRSERWSRLHKTTNETIIVMNPWTRSEIHRAAPLHIPRPSLSVTDNVYDRLGPTPYLSLMIAARPPKLREYEDEVRQTLDTLSMESLEKMIVGLHGSHGLNMDDISEKLCLIRREDIDNVKSRWLVRPITDHIRSKFITCMRNSNIRQLIVQEPPFKETETHRGCRVECW